MRISSSHSPSFGLFLKAGMLASAAFLLLSPCASAQDYLVPPSGNSESNAENDGDSDNDGGDGPSYTHPSGPAAEAKPMGNSVKTNPAPKAKAEAPAPANAQPPVTTAKSNPAASTPGQKPIKIAARPVEDDIYDQWSAKKLKQARKARELKPHPLAMGYPDHFVVVCEAGCRSELAQVVYLEDRSARGPVYKTADENTGAQTDIVACVGGCYGSGSSEPIYQLSSMATSSSEAGSWMTTTTEATPTAKPSKTSGRWYERINGNDQDKPSEPAN